MSASISIRVAIVSAVVAGLAFVEAATAAPQPKFNPIQVWKLGEQPQPKLKTIPAWKLGEQPLPNLKMIPAWKLGEKPKGPGPGAGQGPGPGPGPGQHPGFGKGKHPDFGWGQHPNHHPDHYPWKGHGHPSWSHKFGPPPPVVHWQTRYVPAPYPKPDFPPLELLNDNPVKMVCWVQGEERVIPPGEVLTLPSDRENQVVFHNGERWEERMLVTGVYQFVHPGSVWELLRAP